MIPYASNTGKRRNLDMLRRFGWRLLLTPDNPNPREGLRHGIDNGAWKAYQQGLPFDAVAFAQVVYPNISTADFVVLPDIVAGGMQSLAFSLSWVDRLRAARTVLLPVQDGMDVFTVAATLYEHPNMGIFLGGSTEWKLSTMREWGQVAALMHRHYHVGRCNTARRIRLCAESGADSFDGTSATMFSCTVPMLDAARRQPSLLTPKPPGA